MPFSERFEHSDALFDVALAEFGVSGYEHASINAILQAAGMSKGQFYYHFENKEALYLAVAGRVIEEKRTYMQRVMTPKDLGGDLFSILSAQVRHGIAFAREYPAISLFAESFLREKGNPIYDRALAVYNFEGDTAIDRLVEQAAANGELRTDLPADFVKRAIGFLFTHAAELLDAQSPDGFEAEMEFLIVFMKSGLASKKG